MIRENKEKKGRKRQGVCWVSVPKECSARIVNNDRDRVIRDKNRSRG